MANKWSVNRVSSCGKVIGWFFDERCEAKKKWEKEVVKLKKKLGYKGEDDSHLEAGDNIVKYSFSDVSGEVYEYVEMREISKPVFSDFGCEF